MLLTNQKPPFSRASFFSFESWPGNCFAGVRSRAVQWGASWTFAPACLHCTVISNGKKPLKKSSTKVIFTSFSLQVSVSLHNFRFRLPALHIQDLWNRCIHKYNPTISRIFWNSFLAFFFNLVQLCAVKWKAAILVGASRPWSLSVVHSRVFLWRRSCFFTKKMEDSQNFSNFYQNLWKESTKDLIKQWIKPLSWLSINYLTEKNCYERVSWLNFCFIAPKTRAFPEKKDSQNF